MDHSREQNLSRDLSSDDLVDELLLIAPAEWHGFGSAESHLRGLPRMWLHALATYFRGGFYSDRAALGGPYRKNV